MDPIEAMVNQHHAIREDASHHRYVRKYTKRIGGAAAVALFCLLFTLIGLVHPGLAIPLMVISLMYGCFQLGRCVRLGARWR